MIRYVPLGEDTGYKFAFWDTIYDQFITIGPEQAWDDAADVEEAAKVYGPVITDARLARLLRLIPSPHNRGDM